MRRWWIGGLPAAALVIAGCGGVSIAPEPVLPKALVVAIPAKVGFVVAGEQRTYSHNEERGGVPWSVALGKGQEKLAREVFSAMFREAREFADLDAARAEPGLQAIFDPRIEQYSFATERETGGDYVAVTGPSGSGKSTFMNLAGCLDTPSEGSVIIDGQRVAGMDDDAHETVVA